MNRGLKRAQPIAPPGGLNGGRCYRQTAEATAAWLWQRKGKAMLFNVTFETITEKSAEHGEFEDIGFTMQDVSLREAYDFLRFNAGHCEASCSDIRQARWLTFYNEADFYTGEATNYGLHFPNITGSSRKRIARLFKCVL